MKKLIYLAIPTIFFIANLYIGFLDYENGMNLAKTVFGGFKNITVDQDLFIIKIRMMTIIFFRNLSVAGLIVVTGPFYALPTIIISSFNGYIVGAVAHVSISSRGLVKTLSLLLPHGIIEIPTIIYAGYLSVAVAVEYIKDRENFIDFYIMALKKLATKIAPLLLVAAFIEAFITPLIASLL